MFSISFLNTVRDHELKFYEPFLFSGAKVLEIGGGTGVQALALSRQGVDVTSVEIASSNYAENRVFPIVDYDGDRLPFEDNQFDIIFSSNVLEHILHLDDFHDEMKRVLKEDGYSIHAMPTGAWRAWTNLAHYVELVQRVIVRLIGCIPGLNSSKEVDKGRGGVIQTTGRDILTGDLATWTKPDPISMRPDDVDVLLKELAHFCEIKSSSTLLIASPIILDQAAELQIKNSNNNVRIDFVSTVLNHSDVSTSKNGSFILGKHIWENSWSLPKADGRILVYVGRQDPEIRIVMAVHALKQGFTEIVSLKNDNFVCEKVIAVVAMMLISRVPRALKNRIIHFSSKIFWFASKRFQRAINNLFSCKRVINNLFSCSRWKYLFPCRHGETGNCISEIYTFSRARWTRHFSKNQYIEIEAFPMGLFYTGHMVLNHYLSISAREKLAKILGSSCVLYKIKQAPLYNQNQTQFP